MWIDVEEFWPSAKSLVALQFDSDAAYHRAWWIVLEELDVFGWVAPKARMIAVRKEDVRLFAGAGLIFVERPVADDDAEPMSEEERARYRAWLHELNTQNVERLRSRES